MVDKEKELVEINSSDYVEIKATPKEARTFQNRRLQDRINRIEAKRRQQEKQKQIQTEPRHRTPNGEVICGSLNAAEKQAIKEGDEVEIRRVARLRQRAIQLERERKWGDKVTSFDALRRLKGHRR